MPSDRWTDETLALVMSTLGESTGDEPAYWREEAEDVLTALADAGLLADPAGETREEWSTTLTIADGGGGTTTECGARDWLEIDTQRWRKPSTLVRRTVHVGSWRDVPDAE